MSPVIFLSAAAVGISIAAVALTMWLGGRAKSATEPIAAAAAGILFAVAVLHIGPEAIALNGAAPGFIGAGLAAGWAAANAGKTRGRAGDLVLLGGIAVHSFADGLVLAAAGKAGEAFVLSSATGLLMHELPEGALCYLLARRAGLPVAAAAALAVTAGGVTTFLGALIGAPVVAKLGPEALGALLGFGAGLLMYSALSLLVSRAPVRPARNAATACAAGLAMAAFIMVLPAHDHGAHAGRGAHAGHAHAHDDDRYAPCLYASAQAAPETGCPQFSRPRPWRRDASIMPVE